jgi:hypothetical protein
VTYADALQLRPGIAEALVGLGCARLALASRATEPGTRRALLAQARKALLAAGEQLSDPDLASLRGEPWFAELAR